MEWLHFLGLMLGGVLAAASFIVSKKPDAEELIGKVRPYSGFVGVGLLVLGVIGLIDGYIGGGLDLMSYKVLLGLTFVSIVACELLLGFLLGMPLIAQWIPGESDAETKVVNLSKKLAAYQVTIGFVSLATALIWLLYRLNIL